MTIHSLVVAAIGASLCATQWGCSGIELEPVAVADTPRSLDDDESGTADLPYVEADPLWSQAEAETDPKAAARLYDQFQRQHPNDPRAQQARERAGKGYLATGQLKFGARLIHAWFHHEPNREARTQIAQEFAPYLAAQNQAREALVLFLHLRQHAPTGEGRSEADAALRGLVDRGLNRSDAEKLWSAIRNDEAYRSLAPRVALKVARLRVHVRDFDQGAALARELVERYPDVPEAGEARSLLAFLERRSTVRTRRIGVVLPLTGRYMQYGERSLKAIQMAFPTASGFELSVRDSSGEADIAAKAVESLILDEHVVAIIGPLFSNEALAASLKAEELSTPILSLSYRDGLPELGGYVFRTALTVEAQAKALANLAFDVLGYRRFAILYPRNRFGWDFTESFWDEVEARRGEVRGVEAYEQDQKMFKTQASALVGRRFVGERGEYHRRVAEARERGLKGVRLQAEIESIQQSLTPIIDFDAIVIPDQASNIGLIAPALAYEDIVMTEDPKALETIAKSMGRDRVRPVKLLGASTWNSQRLIDGCAAYCIGAFFVDAYNPNSTDPKVRDFIAEYRAVAGGDPSLAEAQAFDTASLLRKALERGSPTDRAAVRQALLDLEPWPGVTGTLDFDDDGETIRTLRTMTVDKTGIVEWTPPPPPNAG